MLQLIFRNLWQKKARTALTASGLAIATGTLFTLLAFQRGYERGLQKELAQLGAHILVVPKGCPYDAASLALHGANWPCYLKEEYLQQVAQTPGVALAAPALMAAHYGQHREIVVGVTREYLALRPTWRIDGAFPSASGETLLGAEAAKTLQAKVGETIQLHSVKRPLRVVGILNPTAGPDDDFIFMPLRDAQESLLQRERLTHILVKVADPARLEQTIQGLRGCDAGMQMNIVPLAQLFDTIRNITSTARNLLGGLAAVAFLIAGTALANTMLMAALERTREIGVLRALGASTSQIFWLFLGETIALAGAGTVIGLLASLSLGHVVEGWVRDQIAYAPGAATIGLDPIAIGVSAAFALAIAVIAGLAPALRAARLDPVEAFREQAAY